MGFETSPSRPLAPFYKKPSGLQRHTAVIVPRQNSKKQRCWPWSSTSIQTSTCITYMHPYTSTRPYDVCRWFYGGRHIHFISLLQAWTGLSICQQQSLHSKAIKLSCQTNSAFLSPFPFGLEAGSPLPPGFLSPVAHLDGSPFNIQLENKTDESYVHNLNKMSGESYRSTMTGWSRFMAYLCNKPIYQLVGHHHWFVGPQMVVLIPGWARKA